LTGIDVIHCDQCGNEDPIVPAMDELHHVIAEALIPKPGRLDGKEVRFLRKYLEKGGRELSKILHVNRATLSKWENGEDPVGAQSDLLIRALVLAKEKGDIDPLLQKLCAFNSENQISDIIVNPEEHEYEYASE
jgi:DNA-binding transcriptional regulator YiaG